MGALGQLLLGERAICYFKENPVKRIMRAHLEGVDLERSTFWRAWSYRPEIRNLTLLGIPTAMVKCSSAKSEFSKLGPTLNYLPCFEKPQGSPSKSE